MGSHKCSTFARAGEVFVLDYPDGAVAFLDKELKILFAQRLFDQESSQYLFAVHQLLNGVTILSSEVGVLIMGYVKASEKQFNQVCVIDLHFSVSSFVDISCFNEEYFIALGERG